MTKTLIINGCAVRDIPSFYEEVNRVFMSDEDWMLGHSLDALDDMLGGGYGAIDAQELVTIVWQNMQTSRTALGFETTRAYLSEKLGRPEVFNTELIGRQLDALETGAGQTYFDIVCEIIASHPNITLVEQ